MMEFALCATTFILFLVALMQAAYAVYCYNTITNAAREAARYAAVHGTGTSTASIQQAAINSAVGVPLATSNITVTWPTDPNVSTAKDAQVYISYDYKFFGTLTLTGFSRMLVSQ